MSATRIPPPFQPGGPARTMAIVGAIAAAVILAFLGLTVLGGSSNGGSSPGGTAVDSAVAESLATAQLGPGPWQLILAEGIDPWTSATFTTNTSSTPPNCTVSYTPPVQPTTIVVPAYQGNLSSGAAVIWLLGYIQPGSHTAGAALIINGAAEVALRASGANCQLFPSNFTALPANVVDSGTAAQAIDQAGGAQFLASYRNNVSLTMILADLSFSSAPAVPYWDFTFDPCASPLSPTPTGPANATGFDGTVYATNGTVEQAQQVPDYCGPVPPPPEQGMFPFVSGTIQLVRENRTGATIAGQGCTNGDYCYELLVDQPYENDTPADFELSVANSTGVTSSFVAGYALLDPNGTVLVYSIGPQETSWTAAAGTPTTPLVAGDSLWVDMGTSDPSGLFYTLAVQGLGPFLSFGGGYGLP